MVVKKNDQAKQRRKSFDRWLVDVVHALAHHFVLNNWEFIISHCEEAHEDEHGETIASIDVDSRYYRAILYVHPILSQWYGEGQHLRGSKALVHEFTHVFLEPLFKFAKDGTSPNRKEDLIDVLEQTTQHITAVIWENLPKHIFSDVK